MADATENGKGSEDDRKIFAGGLPQVSFFVLSWEKNEKIREGPIWFSLSEFVRR